MLTSYSRVTVVSDSRRVDLALPSGLPIADVMPQVLRFCGPDESPEDPFEFALGRVGGAAFPLSSTLGESGVHDGDVIELRSARDVNRQAYVEDVRDALEDAVDGTGGAWTSRSTVNFAVAGTCAVVAYLIFPVLFGAAEVMVRAGRELPEIPGTVVASTGIAGAVLLGLGWLASAFGSAWSTTAALATASVCAYLTGAELAGAQGWRMSLQLVIAATFALAVGGLGRFYSRRALALVATFAVMLAAPLVVLITDLAGVDDPSKSVRALATLMVLVVGVLPRMSLAVGGLASADYRVRNAGHITEGALGRRIVDASSLLLGTVIGISLAVGAVGVWLALSPEELWKTGVWDTLLSLSLAVALGLRSRVFSRVAFMLPLRVSVLAILLANLWQLAESNPDLMPWLLALIVAIGLVLALVSILNLSDVSRARVKRSLNWLEFIVVVDLVVVTMGALALYEWIRDR